MRFKFAALASAICCLIGSGTAEAQSRWTGLYGGAHVGYGAGDWNGDFTNLTGAIFYNDPFAQPHVKGNAKSILGGLQAGYNHQLGGIVVGMESDITWARLDTDVRAVSVQQSQWDVNANLNMFGTVRSRIGILATPDLLIYATGGFAWGQVELKQATTFLNPPDVGGRTSGTFNHFGYAIGGGGELALSRNWSLRGEYLYIDLGKQNYQLTGTTKPNGTVPYVETFAGQMELHTFKASLNYQF